MLTLEAIDPRTLGRNLRLILHHDVLPSDDTSYDTADQDALVQEAKQEASVDRSQFGNLLPRKAISEIAAQTACTS